MSAFTTNPARAVRLCAASEAGTIAARFRCEDLCPNGKGNPDDHGAFQWAAACGFGTDEHERSFFTQAFLLELARAGEVQKRGEAPTGGRAQ